MPAPRTIELNDTLTITPGAKGTLVVRSPGDIEILRPPSSAVRLWKGARPDKCTLLFGSPRAATLVITGAWAALADLFEFVTGVRP